MAVRYRQNALLSAYLLLAKCIWILAITAINYPPWAIPCVVRFQIFTYNHRLTVVVSTTHHLKLAGLQMILYKNGQNSCCCCCCFYQENREEITLIYARVI